LTRGRQIKPTLIVCRSAWQHDFRRRCWGAALVGLHPPCAPPHQRHQTIPIGRNSTYLKRNSVSTKPATSVHRRKLNAAFGLNWRRAPAHTAVRYILQGLDPAGVEAAFRRHAALLQAARATPGQGSVALDGKTLRGSFDKFHDRAAAQVLSAFATDTALVLAHVDIAEKSNEIPAAQALLAELGLAPGAIVTPDALHCQKNISPLQQKPTSR